MVIDGLRWDFVAGPMGNVFMPVTSKLLANSSGCLLQVKLQSPTVTMPRIKVKLLLLILLFIFLEITSNFSLKKEEFVRYKLLLLFNTGNDDWYSAKFCRYSTELWE